MKYPAILVALLLCGTANATVVTPTPARTFTQSIGVQAHLNRSITSFYNEANEADVINEINYLGVAFVRTSWTDATKIAYMRRVHNATGVKFNYTMGASTYNTMLPYVDANKDLFLAAEGSNEVDYNPITWGELTGYPAATAFNYQMAQDFSARCIQVNTLTVVDPLVIPQIGALPANYYNLHVYLQGRATPTSYLTTQSELVKFQGLAPDRTAVMTETGRFTVPCLHGLTENAQAKSLSMAAFDSFILGIKYFSYYEMNDDYQDDACSSSQNHYGMFFWDDTVVVPHRKVAANVTHNTTTLLADTTSITPTTFNYTLTGTPALGHSLLLQKSDGTFWLALWNDVQLWNSATYADIVTAPVSVTVGLGISATTINVYDPFLSTSVQQTGTGNSIVVNVPDHVVLVNIIP